MGTQGGFGLQVKIDVAGVPTTLAHVLDMDVPEFTKVIAEMTAHDSPGGFYEALDTGKRRVEPFNVTLAWDKGSSAHAAILTAYNGTTPVTFSVSDPLSVETIAVEVFIEKIKRVAKQNDGYKAQIAVHPTGIATLT